jgi:acyl-CoA thioesterase I
MISRLLVIFFYVVLYPAESLQCQAVSESDSIKIACIGDSITFGARVSDPSVDSYPGQLQKLFQAKPVIVRNFGIGGATMIKYGTPNVWQVLDEVIFFLPDIVIIMVGTNDTVGSPRHNWEHIDDFESDYKSFLSELNALSTSPEIFLVSPTDMNLNTPGLSTERKSNLTSRKPRLWDLKYRIEQIAEDEDVNFLDMTIIIENKPWLYTKEDGVHPNARGYEKLAIVMYKAIEETAQSILTNRP